MAEKQQAPADRAKDYAAKLYEAMGLALPQLDTSTQGVLATRLADADIRWGLSLILALWQLGKEPGGGKVGEILIGAGGRVLLDQLNRLGGFLPDTFERFLKSALAATKSYELAGSATYFRLAVQDLGQTQLSVLYKWLRSEPFYETGRALIFQFPAPGSRRPATTIEPPSASRPQMSRAERFDRGDFQRTERTQAPLPSPSATTPVLDSEDVTRVHLASLGWDSKTIERAMNGPRKA